MARRFLPLFIVFFIATVCVSVANAAPGDVIYSEDFQDGSPGGWSQLGGNGTVTVGEYAPGSGEFALTSCCGDTVIISPAIDTGFAGAQLALRIQRGGTGIGSEAPGDNEYLDLYFLDSTGSWQFMSRYAGGTAGETINDSFTLAGDLLHAGFRMRLEQRNGNAGEDFWHLHEISIIEAGASGSIGSLCDDFSGGLARWTVNSFGGSAAVTSQASSSPSQGLAIFDGSARLHSLPLDLADASAATLNLWVRRGDDAFSEDPDGGEDLVIGYIDANGNHQELQVLAGDGLPGEMFGLSFALPANALHDAFQVRIERYGNGAGGYWHVDDVCVDIRRTVDHFAIRHDGRGVNCQAEPVEIVAHDRNHFTVENFSGSLALATSTGNGDWSLLSGDGAFVNNGAGGGSYQFHGLDKGKVVAGLRDTFAETVNINASSGTVLEAVNEDGDLVFDAAGFNVLVNGDSGAAIPVQIAGKPSNVAPNAVMLELQAIRTDDSTGACEAAFTGDVNVELAFSCEEPAACAGDKLLVNGNAIAGNPAGAPAGFTALALNFGDASDSTAPLLVRYADAGRIRLHARYVLQPSGEIMAGASPQFVVRPFGFHVSASGNPGALDSGGAAYRRAGAAFSVIVRAIGWQAADDMDANGVPDGHANADPADNADLSDNPLLANLGNEMAPEAVSLGANLALPASGTNPGLSGNGGPLAFVNGVASMTAGFGDVGIIELVAELEDGDYLGSGNVSSRSGFVGRFIPDHFDVVVGSHGCNDMAGFSYSGQPLRSVSVTARNGAGGITRNFDGALGFAKVVTLSETTGAAGEVLNGGISALDFSNGSSVIGSTPAGIAFRFTGALTPPATISLRATDMDGVSSQGHAEGRTQVRSARFVVDDASAPVLAAARSDVRVETFGGTAWGYELQDTCTTLDFTLLLPGGYEGNLDAGESVIDTPGSQFANGSGTVTMTAPGAGNDGSLKLHYDADPWLEYDWQGTGATDPFGTVRFFGIFAPEPGFIDRHEVIR